MYNFIFLYQLDFDCLETTIIICVVDGLCVCVCVCVNDCLTLFGNFIIKGWFMSQIHARGNLMMKG